MTIEDQIRDEKLQYDVNGEAAKISANTQELTIKNIIPENIMSDEAKKEIEKTFRKKIMKIEKTIDRENIIYRASENTYRFQNFQTIKTFGRDIYNDKITLKEADQDQRNLLVEIMNFKKKTKPQNPQEKGKKSCS